MIKLKFIIIMSRINFRIARLISTYVAVKWLTRVRILRFFWNNIISPIYIHYENRVVMLIESGKVNPQEFVVPMRLSYYSPLIADSAIEDRYDYGRD